MFELHIWGPAFGLPSIDPHCLAAIAYLQKAVPAGKWVVIASSNPALSPTHELPALRDGHIWIGGFRNIFHYLAKHSSGKWALDGGLSIQEGADCVAFSSYLDTSAQPLLDLSLYVSGENYAAVTRPVYSAIQPFPLPYFTPDAIRLAARSRTQHLGLTYLSLDNEMTTTATTSQYSLTSVLPKSLQRPRNTVSGLLAASPESLAQIRLDALASSFFEPIEAFRAKKRYLVSNTQITSLDCLALGYLSLMLIPELPQSWLAKVMRRQYPRLSAWTQELRSEIFGGAVAIQDVSIEKEHSERGDRLPWRKPRVESSWSRGHLFLSALLDGLPMFDTFRKRDRVIYHEIEASDNDGTWSRSTSVVVTSFVLLTAATVGAYCTFLHGIQTSEGDSKDEDYKSNGFHEFGDAGDILGAYAQQIDTRLI